MSALLQSSEQRSTQGASPTKSGFCSLKRHISNKLRSSVAIVDARHSHTVRLFNTESKIVVFKVNLLFDITTSSLVGSTTSSTYPFNGSPWVLNSNAKQSMGTRAPRSIKTNEKSTKTFITSRTSQSYSEQQNICNPKNAVHMIKKNSIDPFYNFPLWTAPLPQASPVMSQYRSCTPFDTTQELVVRFCNSQLSSGFGWDR